MKTQLQKISTKKSGNILFLLLTVLLMHAGIFSRAQTAYITNRIDNAVNVVNLTTSKVTDSIAVGKNPVGVSVSKDGSRVYITNYEDSSVSVINTANNAVIATIPVASGPYGIAVTPDGSRVYVASQGAGSTYGKVNTVSVISTATNTVTATITVGKYPYGVAVSPDGSKVYITNFGIIGQNSTVSVINTSTNTVSATINVGMNPWGIAVSPDGKKAYVANSYSDNVSVINTVNNTVVATIAAGFHPAAVALTPDGKKLYVVNTGSGTVSVINAATNTYSKTIDFNQGNCGPLGISVSPDGSRVYVCISNWTNQNFGVVTTINAITDIDSLKIMIGKDTNPYSFGNFISTHPVGIHEQRADAAGISIYPNPFTSQTTIAFDREQKNTTIRILDILGNEVRSIAFTGKQLALEKEDMCRGIYLVQIIKDKQNIINKKIIME